MAKRSSPDNSGSFSGCFLCPVFFFLYFVCVFVFFVFFLSFFFGSFFSYGCFVGLGSPFINFFKILSRIFDIVFQCL